MTAASVKLGPDGLMNVSGELTFDTVAATLKRSRPLVERGSGPLLVDLAGITRTDSAGLALLIEWVRRAKAVGRELRYANMPEQMQAIARVSDLDHLFPQDGTGAGDLGDGPIQQD